MRGHHASPLVHDLGRDVSIALPSLYSLWHVAQPGAGASLQPRRMRGQRWLRRGAGFQVSLRGVGQFDLHVVLRLVGVVVGHVQGEVGQNLVRLVHVLHQAPSWRRGRRGGIDRCSSELSDISVLRTRSGALSRAGLAFWLAMSARKSRTLRRLGESSGSPCPVSRDSWIERSIRHQVEALGADSESSMDFGNAWWDEALIGRYPRRRRSGRRQGWFRLSPWADGLGGHVSTVNDSVASEDAERRGAAEPSGGRRLPTRSRRGSRSSASRLRPVRACTCFDLFRRSPRRGRHAWSSAHRRLRQTSSTVPFTWSCPHVGRYRFQRPRTRRPATCSPEAQTYVGHVPQIELFWWVNMMT